ncbi:MAG TPA: hypothetical protein VJB82_00070 [Candidatus Peribacterales bacterium]|nr:hypothetical protein [Candidatus Peribacterales bacterium]
MASLLHVRQIIESIGFALIAFAILFAGIAGGGALKASVFDGDGLIEGLSTAGEELDDTGIREETDIVVAIGEIINFALTFAALLAFVAFVVAGFMFILGFGSDSSIERAKKIMIWSIVGLVVIVFAFVIVQFIVDAATAVGSSVSS